MTSPAPAASGLRPYHWGLLGLAGLGQVASSLELGLLSLALPAVARDWSVPSGQIAWIMAAQALGSLTAALFVGSLADRLGRKVILQLGLGLMVLGAAGSALASGLGGLILAQIVVGLGTGCMPPAMNTLLTELAPAASRGRLLSMLQPMWVVGVLLAALLGRPANDSLGPSGVFAVGLLPALFLIPLTLWLPESPRSLLARGRRAEAELLLERLERQHGIRPEVPLSQGSAERSSWSELLAPRLRRRTLCMSVLWATLVSTYTAFLYWLPALLVASGESVERAFDLVLAMTVAQLPPVILVSLTVDRIGRRRSIVAALVASGMSAFWLGTAAAWPQVVLSGTIFAVTNLVGWAVMQGYTPEVFPTRLRARGVGLSSAAGRIAALVTPLLIGVMVSGGGGRAAVFVFVGVLLLVGGGLIAWLGEETRGRPLEEIAA